jgi:hypothetical protein
VDKHGQESLRISIYLPFCEHADRRGFLGLDWARKQVVIVREIPSDCRDELGDHFQPQYRMAFALKCDSRMDCFLGIYSEESSLTLWLTSSLAASYANVGSYACQTCTEGSNPHLSATQSGLQRNSAALSHEIRETGPYFAIIPSQTGP